MSKLVLLLATAITLGAAGSASAYENRGSVPYTFTGTVVAATAACPYKAKTALSGYTVLNKQYAYSPPKYQPTPDGFSVTALIFSPGGTALKSTMKLGNLPARSGSVSGKEQVIFFPDLSTIKGSYKGTFSLRSATAFNLNYTNTFTYKGESCTTTYDLSFAVGVPSKFLNLL
jgi:hypothetical protein